MQPLLLSPGTCGLQISAWRWFCSLHPPGFISQSLLLVEASRLTTCFPTENTASLCACSKTPKRRGDTSLCFALPLLLPLRASLLGAAPAPPSTSLDIHAGTALQAPAPCPGGLPTGTQTPEPFPPAPCTLEGRARASRLCRQTLRWQQTLPRWMETTAAASPICSLAHLVPLRSTAVQLLLEKEPGSAPGANVSTDIYFPLKCIGVFLNLFTTASAGLSPL